MNIIIQIVYVEQSQIYDATYHIINLYSNVYDQEFHYYPFDIKSDRCVGSYDAPIDLSNKVCVPNKA